MIMQGTRLSRFVGGSVVAAVAGLTFVAAARLDPEPYHDGSQVAPALAVASGLTIHRDVFDAYGPITAWLQAAAMEVFEPTVLTARVLMAVLLIAAAVMLFAVIVMSGRSLIVGVFGSLLWVLTWPGQSISWGTPLLPWPSVTFMVLQLAAALIVLRRVRGGRQQLVWVGALGVLLSLAVLARPNYGAPLVLAVLIALACLHRPIGFKTREWATLILGGCLGLGVPVAVLAAQGALAPFLDQALIGPLIGESDATANGTPWFYIENAYLWASLPLLVGLMLIALLGAWRARPRWLIAAVGLIGTLAGILWASAALDSSPIRSTILSRVTWAPALDGQIAQPMFVSAIVTVLLAASSLIVLLRNWRLGVPKLPAAGSRGAIFVVLMLIGLMSLAQLYPIADPNHLWWAAPIPVALTLFVLGQTPGHDARRWATVLFVVPSLVLVPLSAHRYFSIPRVEIPHGVMAGMWIAQDRMNSYAAVDAWLRDLEPASAEFSCEQGLFSVWNGEYLADSPAFVNWAHRMESAAPGKPTGRVFRCTYPYDELTPEDFAKSRGLEIVRTLPEVSLSYFTTVRLDEMRPRP